MRRYHNNYESKGNDAIFMFFILIIILLTGCVYLLFSNKTESNKKQNIINKLNSEILLYRDSLNVYKKQKPDTVYFEKKPKFVEKPTEPLSTKEIIKKDTTQKDTIK